MPENKRPPSSDDLRVVLSQGEVTLEGRLPRSSNATFLVTCTLDSVRLLAVYKPHRGERPLWDFPGGLGRREAAAFELSQLLGWECIPDTVLRPDGPFGGGSFQRFIDADFAEHYFTLIEDPSMHDQLRRLAIFDALANNADRKSGHCLLDGACQLWGIDNGLCFHPQPKLRTVIWDFAGDDITEPLLADVARVGAEKLEALSLLLEADELNALQSRARALVEQGQLPMPSNEYQCYPWPLV